MKNGFLGISGSSGKRFQSAKSAKIKNFQKSQKMLKKGQNLRFVIHIKSSSQALKYVQFSAIHDIFLRILCRFLCC